MSGKGKYKDTLNLPQTEFPMRGNLAKREPDMLAAWEDADLYGQIRDARAGGPMYVLHDGPPYSNGHIHHGHVLNKILKDIVVKSKTMSGHWSPYIPGWDTHGLPIEIHVDRKLGEKKRDMSKAEIRAACREHALHFVDIQREEFRRLGGFGTWDHPYLTLDHGYEATIVRALAAFARSGYLYRGKKPVYWCPRDRTALAEAEIEYKDHTSPSIYVRFPMADDFDPASLSDELAGKKLALTIWTTTPWTLPANLAIVLSQRFDYVAVPNPRVDDEYLLVARELAPTLLGRLGVDDPEDGSSWIAIDKAALESLEGARYRHPFIDTPKAENDFRVWFALYVTLEQGTGLVHTAPGHGADDYNTGLAHDLEPYAPLDDAGRFTDDVPNWAGMKTKEANPLIVQHLADTGYLLNEVGESVDHQYAHCWRCKGPILFRSTPQWFVGIDHNGLRERALSEIDHTQWVPPWGRERIYGMIENRPDWCLSRQRVWGVPIPAFHCEDCDEVHADADTMEAIAMLFAEQGADAWYLQKGAELLPGHIKCAKCGGKNFRPEQDIVDVWFESGCSWFAVANMDDDLKHIDLYLEGSDQHRGWFHSSLLVGIGVMGSAPYKSVITHGWVLDEDGNPYSKSDIEKKRREGKKVKYVPPPDIIKKYGAEMLRLWAGSAEYKGDIMFSEQLITDLSGWYRKLRNTCRYMLGVLADHDPNAYHLDRVELSEIDQYALTRLGDLVARARAAYDSFDFHVVHRALVDYVTVDLSAFYLDVVKDRLYLDPTDSPGRRAAQTVVYNILRALATLSAPILCFTAEDIWKHMPRRDDDSDSVHLALMPEGKPAAEDPTWTVLLGYREAVGRQLEAFRAQKNKSLDARVTVRPTAADRKLIEPRAEMLADLFIVSEVIVSADDAAGDEPEFVVDKHPGSRCERCWKWYSTLSETHDDLCVRCAGAVDQS